MPWNEPGSGNSGGNKDPWGSGNKNRGNQTPDLEDVINNVRKRFGDAGKGGSGSGKGALSPIVLLVLIAAVFWAMRSFYTVQEGFQSIELRFGKYHQTVDAGLQFMWWPVDQKIMINSKTIRTLEIGFRKDTGSQRGSFPKEAQMLTTDENIADVSMAVQYNIRDVEDLLFNVGSVEVPGVIDQVVRGATESALREIVGSTTMDDLFNKGRANVEVSTRELLQNILNRYETGISIIAVEMQAAVPPIEVREAFDNVNKADQLEQQLIKESQAYEEKIVLQAEGTAARLLAEAEGYKNAVIARAAGEGERFTQILTEYQKAPEVTRTRMYIETMEQVLGNTNKVIIDQEGGNNMMYLPLDQIMKNSQRPGGDVSRRQDPQSLNQPTPSSDGSRGGR